MSESPKILLVASSYAPVVGGVQRVASTLAHELQTTHDYKISVLAQRHPRNLPSHEIIDDVNVRRLLFVVPRLHMLVAGRFDLFLASLFYFPLTLVAVLRLIKREQPAIINLHFLGAPAPFLLIAGLFYKFRFVVSLHGDDVEGLSRGTWFDNFIFRVTLRRADAVTACSAYLLNLAQSVEPRIEGKSRVIYNGVDFQSYPATSLSQEIEILGVGRMVKKKGFDVLLRAVEKMRDSPPIRLNLLGDGEERPQLESLARELGIDKFVTWHGAASVAEVRDAMATCRVVVIPSRLEPFGIVALEAMAAGKPIIASRTGGLPEILENADALLIEPDDADALADALTSLLSRLKREPHYGSRNRTLVRRFSVRQMTESYRRTLTSSAALSH